MSCIILTIVVAVLGLKLWSIKSSPWTLSFTFNTLVFLWLMRFPTDLLLW